MATRSKQKAETCKANKDTRPYAIAKYIRIAPSKVHVVLDLIRGKNYIEAVEDNEQGSLRTCTQGAQLRCC